MTTDPSIYDVGDESEVRQQAAEELARSILVEVAELPDRTGPEDQPEMLLVTEHELFDIIVEKLTT
ncbi:MAG: hypothetical protein AAGH60_15565 [Pseudomonadota bacterium]